MTTIMSESPPLRSGDTRKKDRFRDAVLEAVHGWTGFKIREQGNRRPRVYQKDILDHLGVLIECVQPLEFKGAWISKNARLVKFVFINHFAECFKYTIVTCDHGKGIRLLKVIKARAEVSKGQKKG